MNVKKSNDYVDIGKKIRKAVNDQIGKEQKNTSDFNYKKRLNKLQNKVNEHINCCEYKNKSQKILTQILEDKVYDLECRLKYLNRKICVLFLGILMILCFLYFNR